VIAALVEPAGGEETLGSFERRGGGRLGAVRASTNPHRVPLNRASVVDGGLADESVFARFEQLVADNNAGQPTPFTEMNSTTFFARAPRL